VQLADTYDVVIVGAGLAGLTLSRQLLRETDKRILLVDRWKHIPSPRQKYGEATVQLSGYYFAKVLDLEEHLLIEHLPKYNLRFYWKSAGRDNRQFEDYSHGYVRKISNVPTYQLDRNALEAELLRLNLLDPRFTFVGGLEPSGIDLASDETSPHVVRLKGEQFGEVTVKTRWVVDSSGRGRFLARKLELKRQNAIRHGAYYMWVEGHLNIERLTDLPWKEVRLKPDRQELGLYPFWLATNHFCEEGLWFWVIPLRGKTSLGLVFEHGAVEPKEVQTPAGLTDWVCRHFPLFERDLPGRKVLHFSGLADYSHGCAQTISADRWALCGEAGRFLDPLYSPGSDFIALHNTMIVDAIRTDGRAEREAKCRQHEQLVRALYEAFVPGYAESYVSLGDPEAYSLKYTWELAVYYAFYVFPFINDLFTEARFVPGFLRRFGRLGRVNQGLQETIRDFYHWRKAAGAPLAGPLFWEFMNLAPLAETEKTFYEIGVPIGRAHQVLDEQLANLEELARMIVAWIGSRVVDDPAALHDRAFVDGFELVDLRFDPVSVRRRWSEVAGSAGRKEWRYDPSLLERFRTPLDEIAARSAEAALLERELATEAG
jgi:flavin-dependent dehydrogenase